MKILARLKQLALWDGGLPLLWLALVTVQLIPIFNNRLLPMLEAPRDLSIARVWHSAHSADWHISDYYTPLFKLWPGTLSYYLLDLFLYGLPIEASHKLLLSVYVVLFPLSIAFLARALGRSAWLGILAFPLVLNRSFMFGYTGVLLGGALAFLALAALVRHLDEGRGQLALLFLSVLAFLANLATFAVYLVAVVGLMALSWRQTKRLRSALFALGPTLALTLGFALDSGGERVLGDEWVATFKDLPALIGDFPKRVLDVMPGSNDMRLLGVVFGTVLVLALWKGVKDETPGPERRRLLVILIALFSGYSLLPWELKEPFVESAYAARLAPLLAAGFLLLPRRPLVGAQRIILIPVIAASVYLPLKLGKLYRDFSRRNSGFLRLAHEVPRGSRSVVLIAGMRYSRESIDLATDGAAPGAVFWHWGGWPLALNGGYVPYILEKTPFVRVDKQLTAPKQPVSDRVPLRQLPHFDFYFTRGVTEAFDREPALHIVDQFGDWTLLRRVYDLSDEP
jgi:hypothetical protein